MRYYRLAGGGETHLVAADERGVFDLTSANADVATFTDLGRTAAIVGRSVDDVAEGLLEAATELDDDALSDAVSPVVPDEVWAAGVTYEISEEAREEESSMPDLYLDVYEGARPELFFKATASRTVGPGEAVGIRGDSEWDVPEPELGVVLYRGEVVGYTVGNDVSSRSIEGANPLYLPQAKIYERSCAIGPCVASPASVADPHDLTMSLTIRRDGDVVYEDETTTAEMVRTCEELADYFRRHNEVPELTVLLTGTSLVPGEEFTLGEDDVVTIDVESIGVLENSVTDV